jgi:hypothetical protein
METTRNEPFMNKLLQAGLAITAEIGSLSSNGSDLASHKEEMKWHVCIAPSHAPNPIPELQKKPS